MTFSRLVIEGNDYLHTLQYDTNIKVIEHRLGILPRPQTASGHMTCRRVDKPSAPARVPSIFLNPGCLHSQMYSLFFT